MRGDRRTKLRAAAIAVLLCALAVGWNRFSDQWLDRSMLSPGSWWPAAGIALVVFVRLPKRWWLLIMATVAVSCAACDLISGASALDTVVMVTANVVESVVAALVLVGRRNALPTGAQSVTEGLRLIAAIFVGVTTSGLLVGLNYALIRDDWAAQLRVYLLGHVLCLVIVSPLLLTGPLREALRELRGGWRNVEWAVQLVVSVAAACLCFVPQHTMVGGFLLFIPLLWGAARLGPLRAMVSMIAAAGISTSATMNGRGSLSDIADPLVRQTELLGLLTTLAAAVLLMLLSAMAQQAAVAAVAEREESLAEAQRLVQLGSWTWELRGNHIVWSAEMYRLFGVDPKSFRPNTSNWLEAVHAEDRAALRNHLQLAAREGTPYSVDFRVRGADGEYRWLFGRGHAVRDASGAIRGVRGTSQDVTDARNAALQLAQARDLNQAVLSAVSEQAIIGTDPDGRVTVFNTGAEKMFGYSAKQMIGQDPVILHDPDEIATLAAQLGMAPTVKVLAAGVGRDRSQTRQWTYITADGRRRQALQTVTQIRDSKLVGYLAVVQDVTEQRLVESRLRESEERFRLAFDNASVGMYMTSLEAERCGEIVQLNEAMCEFLGRRPSDVVGHNVRELSEAAAEYYTRSGGADSRGPDELPDDAGKWRQEVQFSHADGTQLWGLLSCSVVVRQDEAPYVISLVEDITARKQAEARLRHLALHDPLTGLSNRALLTDRVHHALAASARSGNRVGLLYLDLDGFKQVNDSAGHPAGDELLIQTGARLQAAVRPGDTVARLGGDEFAILCPEMLDDESLKAVARRALSALREPFPLEAGTFTISGSVGAAVSGPGTRTAEELLHVADTAMYGAKRAGKDRLSVASAGEQAQAARDSRLRPALETALTDDELIMYGQPIIDLDTRAVSGVETLLRWQRPDHGVLTPGDFLDVAENSPLMVPIGRRVLNESCRMAATWYQQLGPQAPDVHVNVSGRQLATGTFAQEVIDALDRYRLPADRLVLELTETHMPMMADSLRADMIRLRERGVRLAIDDIGTGYSSLARITELPVDVLKIDMKFVSGLGRDASCDAVVRAVLEIGRALGVRVVAEGVETQEQANLLREYGCELVQGFLFARPQPEHDLNRTLNASASVGAPRHRALHPYRHPARGPRPAVQPLPSQTSDAIWQ